MKTLVIIPCYNEEENIVTVIKNLQQHFPEGDFVVIDDCSTDSSREILTQHGYNHLRLPANLGIGGGVQSGYLYAVQQGYDITVQMDGDGQHSPAYLHALIAPIQKGELDMCIGSRFITGEGFQSGALRRAGIRMLSGLIRLLTGVKIKDVTSGFRACNKELTAFYANYYEQDYPEPEAIIAATSAGFKVGEVPVIMQERQGGVSSINTLKGVYYMLKVGLSLLITRFVTGGKHPRKKPPVTPGNGGVPL